MAKAEAEVQPARGEVADELARELRETLQELQKNLRGILGSVIVDDHGTPLVWDLRGGVEPMLVATAGGMLARATARAADLLDMGSLKNTVLTTEQGSIAIFRIDNATSLVALLQPTANNILVVVEVGKALERLREVMQPGR
ncbi:MAG TPA: roadblock/LC7 domain-containing protein [Candidatus Thermoplasmatota archaeon]|nr:roadblock/LC7 domain-containing protein [Candidatus Thermoplasmatota archaeon]